MSMKTILVPTEHYDSMRSTLETALLLARRCDAYMEGFALRFGISEFVAVDMAGGFPLEAFRQEGLEDEKQARAIFESFMTSNNVPRASGTSSGGLSYGWLNNAPEGEGFVGSYGRVFDVIVLGRPDTSTMRLHNKALESGMFESGRPVLICPPSAPQTIGTNVLVHWNSSTEQARTTALAMPLLHSAERVTVLNITGGAGVPGPSPDQAVGYLQRNGIAATLKTVGLDGQTTGQVVLATAATLGCDLLIKGAYTQSRLRQMIFGGTTQHILEHAAIPVLLAH
jgi:nucleotide-binding universal stress UspA family protein